MIVSNDAKPNQINALMVVLIHNGDHFQDRLCSGWSNYNLNAISNIATNFYNMVKSQFTMKSVHTEK